VTENQTDNEVEETYGLIGVGKEPGGPVEFPLNQVIPGWTEGVQLMVKGEKRRFWIPGNLAYDNSPNPSDPKGTLVFEIELIEIK